MSAVLACAACAGASPAQPARMPASDPLFVEQERGAQLSRAALPPDSDAIAGLVLEPASESARQTALTFLRALLTADAVALQAVFAEQVAFGLESAPRARAELVERCVRETRSLTYAPPTPIEEVVDLDAIEVRRAGGGDPRVALPPGIVASDLIVTLPPRISTPGNAPRVPCLSSVYVRLGDDGRIVGLMR